MSKIIKSLADLGRWLGLAPQKGPARQTSTPNPETQHRPPGDFSDIEQRLMQRGAAHRVGRKIEAQLGPNQTLSPQQPTEQQTKPTAPRPSAVQSKPYTDPSHISEARRIDAIRSASAKPQAAVAPAVHPGAPPVFDSKRRKATADSVVDRVTKARFATAAELPTKCAKATRERVESLTDAGWRSFKAHPSPNELGFIVGFDFGTSSTKIVLHQPVAGNPAVALPVPKELRSEGYEHLWLTAVWFHAATGRFSLVPVVDAVGIDGFKAALVTGANRRIEGVTDKEAACAYLAMMIPLVLGYREVDRPAGFGRPIGFWQFHFGLPVSSKADARATAIFEQLITAAFDLVASGSPVTIDEVRAALASTTPLPDTNPEKPYILYEELAGVISGYLSSSDARAGRHMAVDVGAATLDVTTFLITAGDNPVHIYSSVVAPLGAAMLGVARASGVPDNDFGEACQHFVRQVWDPTHLYHDRGFASEDVALIYVGGGRNSDVHKQLFQGWGNRLNAGATTPKPKSSAFNPDPKTDPARLLLAWGLAQGEAEMREIRLPCASATGGSRSSSYEERFVGKDMM